MSIRVFDTMTRRKRELEPVKEDGQVGMYVCGPTVYDYFHIGNGRTFVAFDVVRRYLRYRGYRVTYVQNLTDIEDRMIKRADELGITVAELAGRFTQEYFRDADALGIERADFHPRATEHIPEIIRLIEKLAKAGYAYTTESGVYFAAKKFARYGRLSRQPLDMLEAGARVEVDEQKRDPIDFALWKKQKPGEPAWDSPWGKGRPGWHIECSAMSMHYLGETIDIHAGGSDLIFPHHENEIAQSEGATGKQFVKYWMHAAFLNIHAEKMSKSLGNFRTVRELSAEYEPEVLRLFLLSSHYRSPINLTEENLDAARSALERLRNVRRGLAYLRENAPEREMSGAEAELVTKLAVHERKFLEAMDDDFNTADALAALFDLTREVNIAVAPGISREGARRLEGMYDELGGVLGILRGVAGPEELPAELLALIRRREDARRRKDWKEADAIRENLLRQGVYLEDTPQGVRWKRVR